MTHNSIIKIENSSINIQEMPLEQNPSDIYLSGLSESGRRTMRHVLNLIADFITGNPDAFTLKWSDLRFQHITAIRTQMIEMGYKPASVNKGLAALRGVLRASWQLGQMTAEDYQKAVSVKGVKSETLPAGRELTKGEIFSLMETCQNDETPAGIRDGAIIGLMYAGGLRREEVITLELADYDLNTGRLLIRGKGKKERTAYLNNGSKDAMNDWLLFRGDELGALFLPINKGGKPQNRPMTPQAIYNMLSKRGENAKIKHFSPHDIRRTFVGDLLDAGADIVTISKMAGHASVTTTARYDRRPEEAKRKAASLLHVPYIKRKIIQEIP
jgi:site-specific recombinase XerD